MSLRRRRERAAGQRVQFRGVSIPRTVRGAGEPFVGSSEYSSLPRAPEVRRLYFRPSSQGAWPVFSVRGKGDGRVPFDSPRLRAVLSVAARFPKPRPPVRPPADPLDLAKIGSSWSEFRRLRADPRVRMCQRRYARREVLFARKVAGRRGSAPGPYRRTVDSAWSCS